MDCRFAISLKVSNRYWRSVSIRKTCKNKHNYVNCLEIHIQMTCPITTRWLQIGQWRTQISMVPHIVMTMVMTHFWYIWTNCLQVTSRTLRPIWSPMTTSWWQMLIPRSPFHHISKCLSPTLLDPSLVQISFSMLMSLLSTQMAFIIWLWFHVNVKEITNYPLTSLHQDFGQPASRKSGHFLLINCSGTFVWLT